MSAMSSQMKDLMMLVETKSHSSPRVLLEGKLNESYIRLAEDIHSDLVKFNKLLVEFQLSQDQIDSVFKKVAQGAKDGYNTDSGQADSKSNRTMLGKGVDAVGKVASAGAGLWNKLKDAISRSAPVEAFDADYNQFIDRYKNSKAGKGMAFLADMWKKLGDKHPKTQGFLIVVLSVLGTVGLTAATGPLGPLGAPAVTGVIRFVDRLLMGDRLSSAAWKAIKMAGLQFLLTQGLQLYGEDVVNWFKETFFAGSASTPDATQAAGASTASGTAPASASDAASGGAAASGLPNASGPIQYTVPSGKEGFLSNIAQKFGISIEQLQAANPGIDPKMLDVANPNNVLAGQKLTIPQATGASVYAGGVGTDAVTRAAQAAGKMGANIGAVKESIDYKRIKRNWALQESLNLPQISAVYLTNEGVSRIFRKVIEHAESNINEGFLDSFRERLTNKITYDSLANRWKRNRGDNPTEGSVDSKQVAEFLRTMGVKDSLINKVYGELEIPTVGTVNPDTLPPEEVINPTPYSSPVDQQQGRIEPTMPGPESDQAQAGQSQADQAQAGQSQADQAQAGQSQADQAKITKYKAAILALRQIVTNKDKGRINAWIEKNWGAISAAQTPKKAVKKKTAPDDIKTRGNRFTDQKTSKPTPAPAPKSTSADNDEYNWKASDTFVESNRRRPQRQITKESKARPPWLGKR